jgi:hypothetical protein
LTPLPAKTLQSLAEIGNLIYHHWKFLLGPEECPIIFPLLRQSAEACNWNKEKYAMHGSTRYQKIHNNE